MNKSFKYFCYSIVACVSIISCDSKPNYAIVTPSDTTAITAPDSLKEATVECAYVADGDTWYFYYSSKKFAVRVLNIDCFETSINDRLADQAKRCKISEDSALILGFKAKALADSLLKRKQVFIKRSLNAPNYDVYDRLLRFCFIDSTRKKYDSIIISRKLDVNTFNKTP